MGPIQDLTIIPGLADTVGCAWTGEDVRRENVLGEVGTYGQIVISLGRVSMKDRTCHRDAWSPFAAMRLVRNGCTSHSSSLMNPPRLTLAVTTALLFLAALYFGAGEVLSRPASRPIGGPPTDFPAEVVRITTGPDQFVAGWFARHSQSREVVLLLHGVRADRTQMLRRARFLLDAGYSTLLIDLPAHGESTGDRITFGARESVGVRAAVEFIRQELPGQRVGVIGVSLGAASTVLAGLQPAPNAVVFESMYPTIEEAVADRLTMRLGPLGEELAPWLLWQLPLRTGVRAADLRPIAKLPGLHAPILIASGTEDQHTRWAETQRLFDAARAPKELWQVPGAAHVDLHAYSPGEYERKVLRFLGKHLRNET